uniref:Flagellar hook-associated protein 2 N-terminal domain-containing protein n=1 Tax=Thermocrinis ruber TaxID=75906 RepID=A0A7C5X1X2_9AQUI
MAGEIYFSNFTGKLDWGSIVDQLLRLKSLPLERMANEANQLKAKQESLSKLANSIDAFNNFFQTFRWMTFLNQSPQPLPTPMS